MALLTINFREHIKGLSCNLTDYCCERNTQYLEKLRVLVGLEMRKQMFRVVTPNNDILYF